CAAGVPRTRRVPYRYSHRQQRPHPQGIAPMLALLIVLQVIASLTLILFILLHAGRGGGLSDMFGGGMSTSLGGSTVVERNLDRLTVGAALIFGVTSVFLALMLAP